MIISCNLFFKSDNYLYSTVQSTINCNLFLSRRMLQGEVTDRELSFAHKMSLQTPTLIGQEWWDVHICSKIVSSFELLDCL